jgi:tRNA (guanine37-N1)-methyltransferase
MHGYDILGNIALVKFDRKSKSMEKKKQATEIMKQHSSVSTVLEKSGKFSGRLRTLTSKFILGVKTKEAIFKENNCVFRFNVDSCYFSPRLGSERLEIAKMVNKGENVLVGRECKNYALENKLKNKTENVEIIQGDVRKILPKMKEKFDRIVMARPNLKDSFLDVSFPLVKKGSIMHYYGFYHEDATSEMKSMIEISAKKAKKKIKILNVKKAGDIGLRKYRYRVDLKILN